MKIISKFISYKYKTFRIKVEIEENTDDCWNLYNLMNTGDFIQGKCRRKVQKDTLTGLVQNEMKILNLVLQIKKFEYMGDADRIRIKGMNVKENQYCGLGQIQSMDVMSPFKVTLIKKQFDSIHVKKFNEAIATAQQGQVCVILMQEGLCQIYMVNKSQTIFKSKIEKHIPKKKGEKTKLSVENKLAKFFNLIEQDLQIKFNIKDHGAKYLASVKSFIIASPGFVKNNFHAFLTELATKKNDQLLKSILQRTIMCHCANAFKQSLKTVMSSQLIQHQIEQMGFSTETQLLDKFFETLRTEDTKVCYGRKSVECAMENQAVETLLISDHLFRSTTTDVRKSYVKLSESGEKQGLKVFIFSSETPVGHRLKNMTGVACILRFALPELDDVEEELDNDSEEESSSGDSADKSSEEPSFDEQNLEMLLDGIDGIDDVEGSIKDLNENYEDYAKFEEEKNDIKQIKS